MIYFDNNATTALDPLVLEAIIQELSCGPSNPSSVHTLGGQARGRLASLRHQVAKHFSVQSQEIVFTSGATEALNQVLFSFAERLKGRTILASSLEHAAVDSALKSLQKKGHPVRFLPGTSWGAPKLEEVEAALTDDVGLMVFMAANNETGVKTDLNGLAALAEKRGLPLIVDGVALVGKETFILPKGVTAFVFSAHKFHGPKGAGALIIRSPLSPLIHGGPQENGRRAGTENLASLVGLAKALEIQKFPISFRRHFESLLLSSIGGLQINGEGPRLESCSNLSFEGLSGESLLIHLDQAGLLCSFGSACSSGTLSHSRILLAMGLGKKRAESALRFSFSRFNTLEEIEKAVDIIQSVVKKIR